MQIIAALRTLLSRPAKASATRNAPTCPAEHQLMLAELRSLFHDDLADHDRTACRLALKSTTRRNGH